MVWSYSPARHPGAPIVRLPVQDRRRRRRGRTIGGATGQPRVMPTTGNTRRGSVRRSITFGVSLRMPQVADPSPSDSAASAALWAQCRRHGTHEEVLDVVRHLRAAPQLARPVESPRSAHHTSTTGARPTCSCPQISARRARAAASVTATTLTTWRFEEVEARCAAWTTVSIVSSETGRLCFRTTVADA